MEASYQISGYSRSLRRSRQWWAESDDAGTLPSFATAYNSSQGRTTLEILVQAIVQTGLPGPVLPVENIQSLGQGSQFNVYKKHIFWFGRPYVNGSGVFAVKEPRYRLDTDAALDMTDAKTSENIHHIYLEIASLMHPKLRNHPNIIKLYAWSHEVEDFHGQLALVMELASTDLATWFQAFEGQLSMIDGLKVLRGVASGLDALHDCGLIHGDLKPENILLIPENTALVPKLADFGLSMDETGAETHLGGTRGWMAPEVESGQSITAEELQQADNYSYGLLAWATALHSGDVPPQATPETTRRDIAISELASVEEEINQDHCEVLQSIFRGTLEVLSCDRPRLLSPLFGDTAESPERERNQDDEGSIYEEDDSEDEINFLPWEPPAVPEYFAKDLLTRHKLSPGLVPSAVLFSVFLMFTRGLSRDYTVILEAAMAAASEGSLPAQASLPRIRKFYEAEIQEDAIETAQEHLKQGVTSGSVTAKVDLLKLDPEACSTSLQAFRAAGGYCPFYWPTQPASGTKTGYGGYKDGLDTPGTRLHWLATYGLLRDLIDYLETTKVEINTLTEYDETPLYLACARSSWDHAREILIRGGDPTIPCTDAGITCMHWIFAFDESSQNEAVESLVSYGARIDTIANERVPFFHYPFVLPSGTSLQWAVMTHSHSAIRALLRNGADVLVRDGFDPYRYDGRFRYQEMIEVPNQELFSVPNSPTDGLSSLDMAALERDPFIFEVLAQACAEVDINSADEEGLTVLHRLSSSNQRRTASGVSYNSSPFRGPNNDQNAEPLVSAIVKLGGDIEKLTKAKFEVVPFSSKTPLMLAVSQADIELVTALIDHGANVNAKNDVDETALFFIPDIDTNWRYTEDQFLQCVKILVSHGADVNHRARWGRVILKAAYFRLFDVVEFLLEQGADIDEREEKEDSPFYGSNLFAALMHGDETSMDSTDRRTAQLIEKHVLACPDEAKRKRVLEVGDHRGFTLLHRSAEARMTHCVNTLLQSGVPVNPLAELGDERRVWYMSPLDSVISQDDYEQTVFEDDKQWSKGDFQIRNKGRDIIKQNIRSAGGKTAGEIIKGVDQYALDSEEAPDDTHWVKTSGWRSRWLQGIMPPRRPDNGQRKLGLRIVRTADD